MTFHGSVELPLSRFHRIGVECEIAARLGADLSAERAPYSSCWGVWFRRCDAGIGMVDLTGLSQARVRFT